MKKVRILSSILVIALVGTLLFTGCGDSAKYDYKVLVNKYTKLPDNWEENVELVEDKGIDGDTVKVEKKAYEQFKKLKEDLEKDGIDIELDSVYRSVEEQQDLWDRWTVEEGIDYVKKYVAVPGYSEHHTGLAIDICLVKDGKVIDENDDMLKETEIFSKVHEKMGDYGFILRYLPGDENKEITGYEYEPWHLRYIDDVDVAKQLNEKQEPFETYLGEVTDLKNNESAAKYQIEIAFGKWLDAVYRDTFENARYDVKLCSEEDLGGIKLDITDDDIPFIVTYDILPTKEPLAKTFTIPNGEYNKESGWVEECSRVGIFKKTDDGYTITDVGAGF